MSDQYVDYELHGLYEQVSMCVNSHNSLNS